MGVELILSLKNFRVMEPGMISGFRRTRLAIKEVGGHETAG
jgi:hypothetical protein